jgi:hypothetical protein
MKRKRHSPEQIIRKLRTADQLLKSSLKNPTTSAIMGQLPNR